MDIAKPEMYRICYNPSIRDEEKAELAPAWKQADRQSFAALIGLALCRVWDCETAALDDWNLKPL